MSMNRREWIRRTFGAVVGATVAPQLLGTLSPPVSHHSVMWFVAGRRSGKSLYARIRITGPIMASPVECGAFMQAAIAEQVRLVEDIKSRWWSGEEPPTIHLDLS